MTDQAQLVWSTLTCTGFDGELLALSPSGQFTAATLTSGAGRSASLDFVTDVGGLWTILVRARQGVGPFNNTR